MIVSIIDDSAIICDDVIKSYDEKINFDKIKAICKAMNFYILLVLLLITIALLLVVSIYCYLIKYQGKHLLPFHNTNNKLNKFCIDSIH